MTRWSVLLLLSASLPLAGCTWGARQNVDQTVCAMSNRAYDVAPELPPPTPPPSGNAPAAETAPANAPPASQATAAANASARPAVPEVPTDVQTVAWMEGPRGGSGQDAMLSGVQAAAWMQSPVGQRRLDLNIPTQIPGSEAPRVQLPRERGEVEAAIDRIYGELPPLPGEPKPQPGPDGKPYTLSELQRLAAANSPTLRQAAADVENARGALIQAKTYSNPTFSYLFDPSNNNSTAGVQGGALDQVIRTGGKQKLAVAAAQKDYENAELALKRARSDLSTAVRNAYFTLLVDVETLTVTRSLARFTDDIYRLQTGILRGALAAPYEPASLRAQAFTMRLAYNQAISSYIYDWKQLVATIGLHQLPLSEVSGRVDKLIPYYEYDRVLDHVLKNHTDILTARNLVPQAKYNLKLAQVTPIVPDIDLHATYEHDTALAPFGTYQTMSVSFPVPIWDQNKGNILSAESQVVRATEEWHRVEVTLTTNLASAYANYQNNLYAIEYYRNHILPDLVRYYRGIYARRQIDPTSAFGDLVMAQQTLAANVTTYIGILQSLWTSVVAVADFLQTDDLFQIATPRELPEMPDFSQPPQWLCGHEALAARCAHGACQPGPCCLAPVAGQPPMPGDVQSMAPQSIAAQNAAHQNSAPQSIAPLPDTAGGTSGPVLLPQPPPEIQQFTPPAVPVQPAQPAQPSRRDGACFERQLRALPGGRDDLIASLARAAGARGRSVT